MCYTCIQLHPCGHSALLYRFCNGVESNRPPTNDSPIPCGSVTFTLDVEHFAGPCTIEPCAFDTKGRGWICCKCDTGSNLIGSCAGRDEADSRCCHICCAECKPKPKSKPEEPTGEKNTGTKTAADEAVARLDALWKAVRLGNNRATARRSRTVGADNTSRWNVQPVLAAIALLPLSRLLYVLRPHIADIALGVIQGTVLGTVAAAMLPPLLPWLFPVCWDVFGVLLYPVVWTWMVAGLVSPEWADDLWANFRARRAEFGRRERWRLT